MKITFVGTSSGKASLDRFHSSLLFSTEDYNLLVDVGDGISRALLVNGVNFNSIDGIIFTHLHPDHFSGLPALIVQMKMMNRKEPLDIYIHQSLKNVVEDFLLNSYLLPAKMNLEILYRTFKDDDPIKISDNFSFLARKNSHLVELEKYKVNHPSISLYSASLLFEAAGKKIIYTSDISSANDLFLFKEITSNIFISEATHLKPPILFEALNKMEAEQIYLTHFSDEDLLKINEIMATIPNSLRNKIIIAVDGLSFEI